jgi:hypothetical protein
MSEASRGSLSCSPKGSMTRLLACALLAVCLALVLAGFALLLATTDPFALQWKNAGGLGPATAGALVYLTYATVGALLVTRRPAHAVGWLCCALGLTQSASFFAGRYAAYALFQAPGTLPAGEWAVWFGQWVFGLMLAEIALLMLLFPDGRPPSPRWGPVAWVGVGAVAVQTLGKMVRPGPMVYAMPNGHLDNPAGLESIGGLASLVSAWAELSAMLFLLIGLFSLVVRYRRSRGAQRAQIKMVAAAGGIFVLVSAITLVAIALGPAREGGGALMWFFATLIALAFALFPIAIGVATLRRQPDTFDETGLPAAGPF